MIKLFLFYLVQLQQFLGVLLDIKNLERLSLLGYIIVCIMLLAVDVLDGVLKEQNAGLF